MKNQYIGDVGDYGKYSLLQAFVNAGFKVGVNWYLTENDDSNDGKYITYLNYDHMRQYNPEIFDTLKGIAVRQDKSIADIQNSSILPDAIFYDEQIDVNGSPKEREGKRRSWFEKSISVLADTELIFMDPDNGLMETGIASKLGAEKYIFPEEVERYYNEGYNVVYYCHKGRRSYDAWDKYISLMFDRIPDAKPIVLTYHKGSQRSYVFLIHENYYKQYRRIIDSFKNRWGKIFSEEYTNKGNIAGAAEGDVIKVEKADGTTLTIM